MFKAFVGTSGWVYDWNVEGTLDWYVRSSHLNAVELNASFYRFPYRNQVLGWSRRGEGLRWSIKVHRSVTHTRKLSDEALNTWFKFHELFKPMEELIDFFLFQLPPNFSCRDELLDRVKTFYRETGLNGRFAVEFRHPTCFTEEVAEWGRELGLTLVSVDSPTVSWLIRSSDSVYLRLHGRRVWYAYDYSLKELAELVEGISSLSPDRVYVFFNNDHWMLEDARAMLAMLKFTRTQG
ncbi:MAG: DUF72 domain-containing protein [Zestosphaera sp.]